MNDESMSEKRSPDDEHYRIPGTNLFNLTAWIRENVDHPEPAFKVGDRVLFTIETEITRVYKDCDGSTLYEAYDIGGGWNEEGFTLLDEKSQPPEENSE